MEAPERIWLDLSSEDSLGMFIANGSTNHYCNMDVEYIRADLLDAHIGAVLAEAAKYHDDHADGYTRTGAHLDAAAHHTHAKAILALRHDALQSLERVRREAREEGMRAAQASALARYHAGDDLLGVVNALSDMLAAEKEGKP